MTAARTPPIDSSGAWQRFWATGVVDTFGSSLSAFRAAPGPDSPPLFGQWRAWLSSLPAEGELLDVGCGNGAVLCHLLVARPADPLRGIGVDMAQPAAEWLNSFGPDQRQRVECRGGVSAETLPFAAGRFDACASQFGIEYSDLRVAVPETLRVLRPDAQLGWILHHAGGRPARLAHEELSHLEWLERCGWLAAAGELMSAVDAASRGLSVPSSDVKMQSARARVENLLQGLKERAARSPCPDLLADVGGWTQQGFSIANCHGVAAGHAALHQIQALLADTRARLLDLITHALDEAAWRDLLDRLRSMGVALGPQTGPLLDRGHLMGWWVDGRVGGQACEAASAVHQ